MRSWVVNKKILLIGASAYILVVAVTGFLLFAKQSPVAWFSANVTEVCYGVAGPIYCPEDGYHNGLLLASYADYEDVYVNYIAQTVNKNLAIAVSVFTLASVVYFGLIFTSAGRRNE